MSVTTATRERGILFSAPMIRAVLNGRKSMTRRVVTQPKRRDGARLDHELLQSIGVGAACPYGAPGDRLWVRETWKAYEDPTTLIDGILYRADGAFRPIENTREAADRWGDAAHRKPAKADYKRVSRGASVAVCEKHVGWRPSILMPRWASRIILEITAVRAERLQEITEADAVAEGFRPYSNGFSTVSARARFATLWDKLNSHRSGCDWCKNPWVWVIEFRRLTEELQRNGG